MDHKRIFQSRKQLRWNKLSQEQMTLIKSYIDVPEETLDLIIKSVPPHSDPVTYIIRTFGNKDAVLPEHLQEQGLKVSSQSSRNLVYQPPIKRPEIQPNKKSLLNKEEDKNTESARNLHHTPKNYKNPISWGYYRHQDYLQLRRYEEARQAAFEQFRPSTPMFPPFSRPPSIPDYFIPPRFSNLPQVRNLEMNMTYENLLELDKDSYNIGNGLSEQEISLIPEILYDSSQHCKTCSICQTDYEENERVSLITCFHIFHQDCIRNWLLRRKYCPICQYRV